MTKKLYYDPEITQCEAQVCDCRPFEQGGFEVLLDQTIIYPEGGGQPSDTGFLDDARVSYAFEEGEDVWHRCERAFPLGARVCVRFDEARRRDHTQQHTGEHILSGLAASLYNCSNVGFHMAEDYVSVDFDRALDAKQVEALALAANETIMRNGETVCRIVDAAMLPDISLRKSAKGLQGEVRIVYAGGVDSCTCCGTHCKRAGEVGVLKILSHMNYKGGTRVFFLCGMRAVHSMMEDAALLDAIARRFSTKPADALTAIVKQGDELAQTKRQLKKRTDELFSYRAREVLEAAPRVGNTVVVAWLGEGLNMTELGLFAEMICAGGNAIAEKGPVPSC